MVLVFKKQEMPAEMKTGNENVKKAGEPFKIKLNFGLGGKKKLGKKWFEASFLKFKADIFVLKADFLVGKWC